MTAVRILCVDDSPADRLSIQLALEGSGFDFSVALSESADGALARLRDVRPGPQMMLVDVNMPGTSGLQLLSKLKKDPRWRVLPIWMLSGSDDPRYVRSAFRNCASGYLRKPADGEGLSRLAETIARLCQVSLLPEMED